MIYIFSIKYKYIRNYPNHFVINESVHIVNFNDEFLRL